jgi:hypothetical protein
MRNMPHHDLLGRATFNHTWFPTSTEGFQNVQRLLHESIGLLDFHLYDMPHESADGLQTFGVSSYVYNSANCYQCHRSGEVDVQAMESTMPSGARYQTGTCRLRKCRITLARNMAAIAGLILSFALAFRPGPHRISRINADGVWRQVCICRCCVPGGGSNAGLTVGQALIISERAEDTVVAQIEIESVVHHPR